MTCVEEIGAVLKIGNGIMKRLCVGTVLLLCVVPENRSIGETQMNEHSSRSHAIFTFTLESMLKTTQEGDEDGIVKVAALVCK